MPDEDELLRGALGPGKECPPLEQLLTVTAASDLARHLETCAYCRTELALLQRFSSDELDEAEREPVRIVTERLRSPGRPAEAHTREPWWRTFWRMPWVAPAVLAAAATALLLTFGISWRHGAPELLAPGAGQEILRSGAIALAAPVGDLKELPAEFRWEAVPGAVKYHVRLMEVDRTEVWSADSADNRMPVPGEARSLIVPHKTLLWDVTALDAQTRSIAQSAASRFRFLQNPNNR